MTTIHPRTRTALAVAVAALVLGCATSSAGGGSSAGGPQGDGARLYRSHCGSCHRLRDPGERTQAAWAKAVAAMSGRAHLGDEDREAVLAYLQARASDAPKPAAQPDR